MIAAYDLLMQVGLPTKPESFWPVSVVGYIEVLGFLGTIAYVIYQSGRWTQKIENYKRDAKAETDGLGARVGRVELGQTHEEGRVDALEVQVSRTQGQYEALINLLGGAKESVDSFKQGMVASTEKIERKIDELRQEQNNTKLVLSERLKGVETTLQIRDGRA